MFTETLPTAPEEGYTPQDTSGLPNYEGYGAVGFSAGGMLPPPVPTAPVEPVEPSEMTFGT